MAPKVSAQRQAKAPASSASKYHTKGPARKTAPSKQPLPVPERLKRLFTSLCAQIEGGYFTNAIKTCDKILRLQPDDPDALQTKLFLLLQTEQYTPALEIIDADEASHKFERAYSLYRLQHEAEAREILTRIKDESKGEEDRAVVHLEAQLNYREGAYQVAFDLYNQLLDTAEPNTEEHSDILTNLQAAQKHLDFIETDYLRALDALPASLTTTIESAPPPTQPQAGPSTLSSATKAAVSAAEPTQPVPKKVRASRVPAGVVPGVTPPPDPERWLKKSERSTFGQGKRRKAGGGGGATQGSALGLESGGTASSGGGTPAKGGAGGKGKKKK